CCAVYVVFFFSSRRRHTRFSRDWSSDVCSSDLVWINRRLLAALCRKNMIELVFDQAIAKRSPVVKAKCVSQVGLYAHFFLQPAYGSLLGSFRGPWVAAACVGPETATVIFMCRPLLQEQTFLVVKHKNTERPMKATAPMRLHLLHGANLPILLIYQYNVFDTHDMLSF